MVTRKKLLKLALIFAILCAVFFVLNYFCYHYTDDSNSDVPGEGRFFFTSYHEDCRKPFVTDLLGQMGICWLFATITCVILAFVICDSDKAKKPAEITAKEDEIAKDEVSDDAVVTEEADQKDGE
ncbi:MAG: hypothetical protein MJ193_01340 [Clostridia bacterium]|nr:hypothetical protein [Clostridia bacterium]